MGRSVVKFIFFLRIFEGKGVRKGVPSVVFFSIDSGEAKVRANRVAFNEIHHAIY